MRLFRAALILFLLLNHVCVALIARLFLRDTIRRRRYFLRKATNFSRRFFRILHVEVIVENPERLRPNENYCWLANHMSYLDALLLASLRPVCFITSVEMKNTPLLGLLTELGGCLYTERRSRENLRVEVSALTSALQEGFDLAIFPEGTSTNGSGILPFKRGLLSAAIEAKKSILPITIQYLEIGGEKVNTRNRDLLCWYGDMSFAPHFLKLLMLSSLKIRLSISPGILMTERSSRDSLVAEAFEAINATFEPIQ